MNLFLIESGGTNTRLLYGNQNQPFLAYEQVHLTLNHQKNHHYQEDTRKVIQWFLDKHQMTLTDVDIVYAAMSGINTIYDQQLFEGLMQTIFPKKIIYCMNDLVFAYHSIYPKQEGIIINYGSGYNMISMANNELLIHRSVHAHSLISPRHLAYRIVHSVQNDALLPSELELNPKMIKEYTDLFQTLEHQPLTQPTIEQALLVMERDLSKHIARFHTLPSITLRGGNFRPNWFRLACINHLQKAFTNIQINYREDEVIHGAMLSFLSKSQD